MFRGRKLPVADVQGLRPTGDRVRETLFNWLQGDIAGAQCLDLFAGSGALGFEALSRHAKSVSFVEPDVKAHRMLAESCRLLEVPVVEMAALNNRQSAIDSQSATCVIPGTAQSALDHWLAFAEPPQFDLVFIDPPFQMNCQWSMLELLVPALVAHDARIYIESPVGQLAPGHLPSGCELLREKRFGDVMARLLRFSRSEG